jgi:hypothetical protein
MEYGNVGDKNGCFMTVNRWSGSLPRIPASWTTRGRSLLLPRAWRRVVWPDRQSTCCISETKTSASGLWRLMPWCCVLACGTPVHYATQLDRVPLGDIDLRLRAIPPPLDQLGDVGRTWGGAPEGCTIPSFFIRAGEIIVLVSWWQVFLPTTFSVFLASLSNLAISTAEAWAIFSLVWSVGAPPWPTIKSSQSPSESDFETAEMSQIESFIVE